MWNTLRCFILSVGLLLPLAREVASKPKRLPPATSQKPTQLNPSKLTPAMLHGKIVFVQDKDLWCINADGSGRQKILTNPFGHWNSPSDIIFSPDLSHLILPYTQSGDNVFQGNDLAIMRIDGTQRKVLVANVGTWQYRIPRFSPDGSKIVYTRWTGSHHGGYLTAWADIWLINPDGSHSQQLLGDIDNPHTTHAAYYNARWSRDGRRIFYLEAEGGIYEDPDAPPVSSMAMSVQRDGTDPRSAAGQESQFLLDDISPDGRQRIVVKKPDNAYEYGDLYIQNLDSSQPHRLTTNGQVKEDSARFSPDGKQIIFDESQSQTLNGSSMDFNSIWIINTDGSGLRCLIDSDQTKLSFVQWLH